MRAGGGPRLGHPLIHLSEVDSTNHVAARMADEGAPEGTTVIADRQTSGRGRLDRSWSSPTGGLWLTTILRPPPARSGDAAEIGLVAGVAVAEAVAGLLRGQAKGVGSARAGASGDPVGDRAGGPGRVGLKWPNDVLLDHGKLAGILGQVHGTGAVLCGIGLNLNVRPEDLPPDVARRSASLARAVGHDVDPTTALAALNERLSYWYDRWLAGGFAAVRNRCLELSVTVGHRVSVSREADGGGSWVGLALDILGDGALLVATEDGREVVVRAADVSIRPVGRAGPPEGERTPKAVGPS